MHTPPPPTADEPPPRLSLEGAAVLRRAAQRDPRFRSRAFVARFRAKLVDVLNDAVGEKPHQPETAVHEATQDFSLGFSYIAWKGGEKGLEVGEAAVRKYCDPELLRNACAHGRSRRTELLLHPLRDLERRNRVSENERLSGLVNEGFENVRLSDTQIISAEMRAVLHDRTCSSYPALLRHAEEIRTLNRVLDLTDTLGIDHHAIERAKGDRGSRIESGLKHLMGEMSDAVQYVEIGVFCATYARVHGIEPLTPVTFRAADARPFTDDLGDDGALTPEVLAAYEAACDERFGEQADVARVVLAYYLEHLQSLIGQRAALVRRCGIQFAFPVDRFTADALA